jgi:uncharacterized membrane protein YhaH (DUF805 family)
MSFYQAISACLSKYANFQGRATRSEFWWFYWFTVMMAWVTTLLAHAVGQEQGTLTFAVTMLFLIPMLAVGSRRLHDTGRSGWWLLLSLTLIGLIVLVFWWASASQKESNIYGSVHNLSAD